MTSRRLLPPTLAAWIGLGGILFALILGIGEGWSYLTAGFVPHFLRSVRDVLLAATPRIAVAVAAGWIAAALAGRHLRRAWRLSAAVAVVATILFLLRANDSLFRRVLSAGSAAWTVGVGLLALALLLLSFRSLRRPRRAARVATVAVGVAAVLAVALAAVGPSRERDPRPNVLLILVDAMRADGPGFGGNPRRVSPHLDALAEDGVVFTQAIAQATFTKSSMSSLMTGLYPFRHGVYEGNLADREGSITSDVLPPAVDTWAERFRRGGFDTEAFLQQAQLAAYMGFSQGFVRYREGLGRLPTLRPRVTSWLDSHGSLGPFFGYVHVIDLHDPYHPPDPWRERFAPPGGFWDKATSTSWTQYLHDINDGKVVLGARDLAQWRGLYDALIAHIDDEIGKIVERLKADGLYDRTMIVVTADHGDGFLEHGFLSHSNVPYEELCRVPLLVKYPGGKHAGRRVDAQVRLVDVLPTALAEGSLPGDPTLDGASLTPLAEGLVEPERTAVIEFDRGVAIRTPRTKYILFLDGKAEMYDLAEDPEERRDLVGKGRPEEAELARHARLVLSARLARKAGERVPLDPATIEELRSLGYIR